MVFKIFSDEALLICVTISSDHWVPKDALQQQCHVTNSNDTVSSMPLTAGVIRQCISRHAALCGVSAMSTYRGQWALGTFQFLLDAVYLLLQVPPFDACIVFSGLASGLWV